MLGRPYLLSSNTKNTISATSTLLLTAQAKSQVQGVAPVSDTGFEATDSPPDPTPRDGHTDEKLAFEQNQTHCLSQVPVRNGSRIELRAKGDQSTGRDLTNREHPAGPREDACVGGIQPGAARQGYLQQILRANPRRASLGAHARTDSPTLQLRPRATTWL